MNKIEQKICQLRIMQLRRLGKSNKEIYEDLLQSVMTKKGKKIIQKMIWNGQNGYRKEVL